jgi:hypothetical protein
MTCNGTNQMESCSGNGYCLNNKCECFYGYFGNNCEETTCNNINSVNESSVCSRHGKCNKFNECDCYYGYYGRDCEIYFCYGTLYNDLNVCSGKGECKSPDNCDCIKNKNGVKCELCISGWHGEYCDLFKCNGVFSNDSKICSNNGKCSVDGKCICQGKKIILKNNF